MADQKRWFKVWTSILIDPDFQSLSLEDTGRWMILMAVVASSGTNGVLRIPNLDYLARLLRCDEKAVKNITLRLPNTNLEEGKIDNGSLTLSFNKWFTYQVDSTGYERVKRSRYKRRREEKRLDKKRREVYPKDFSVSESIKNLARKNQWPDPLSEVEKFRDFHIARGSLMADWEAAFRTWLRNAKAFSQRRGKPTGKDIFSKLAEPLPKG